MHLVIWYEAVNARLCVNAYDLKLIECSLVITLLCDSFNSDTLCTVYESVAHHFSTLNQSGGSEAVYIALCCFHSANGLHFAFILSTIVKFTSLLIVMVNTSFLCLHDDIFLCCVVTTAEIVKCTGLKH